MKSSGLIIVFFFFFYAYAELSESLRDDCVINFTFAKDSFKYTLWILIRNIRNFLEDYFCKIYFRKLVFSRLRNETRIVQFLFLLKCETIF